MVGCLFGMAIRDTDDDVGAFRVDYFNELALEFI